LKKLPRPNPSARFDFSPGYGGLQRQDVSPSAIKVVVTVAISGWWISRQQARVPAALLQSSMILAAPLAWPLLFYADGEKRYIVALSD
jgi:hypothetical protein